MIINGDLKITDFTPQQWLITLFQWDTLYYHYTLSDIGPTSLRFRDLGNAFSGVSDTDVTLHFTDTADPSTSLFDRPIGSITLVQGSGERLDIQLIRPTTYNQFHEQTRHTDDPPSRESYPDFYNLLMPGTGPGFFLNHTGTPGNDFMEGFPTDDFLNGGPGDDNIRGYGGNDQIFGGEGNDTLISGPGQDTLNGGPGRDVILIRLEEEFNKALQDFAEPDTILFQDASFTIDDIIFSPGSVIMDIDVNRDGTPDGRITLEGDFADRTFTVASVEGDTAITLDALPVVRTGTDGDDSLEGGPGDDRLIGLGGDDTLAGMDGADTLNGGDGDDLIRGGATEADRRDVIYGGAGNDSIDAGHGNDLVFGQGGNDTIAGGFGADELQGQDGDDVITGSAFGDIVFGNAGNDFVNGGFGHDLINGGAGADKFFHTGGTAEQMEGHGSDWVQDYNSAEGDVLVFGGAATADQFQVNLTHTANKTTGERSGDDDIQEAFVIYKPTGQILWALVDGGGEASINLQIGAEVFDLLA